MSGKNGPLISFEIRWGFIMEALEFERERQSLRTSFSKADTVNWPCQSATGQNEKIPT